MVSLRITVSNKSTTRHTCTGLTSQVTPAWYVSTLGGEKPGKDDNQVDLPVTRGGYSGNTKLATEALLLLCETKLNSFRTVSKSMIVIPDL